MTVKKPKKKPKTGKKRPKTSVKAPVLAVSARGSAYDSYKAGQAAISRERSKTGREIGKDFPEVVDRERKESCRRSLRLFCETYLPQWFRWAWSADHLTALERLQVAILQGGQFAFAMPRGSGKSSICETGAMFAMLYGHRRFVALIGATEDAAKESLLAIKTEFETNPAIYDDFPEVCYPIRCLEGINNRANGQTLNGVRTRMQWTDTKAVLPTVEGSPASGTRVRVAGITGRVRGMKATTAAGESIRPDLAIVDDPQTDESAPSVSQNRKREKILNGAVLGLSGPGTKIAAFMPCTVIAPGDMADNILNRDKYPSWQGQRTRMVISWPVDQAKWDEYAELRGRSLKADGRGEPANEFYAANREAMDLGAIVSWVERFNPDELSAIQHAWNLRIDRGTAVFNAEYQNDPDPVDLGQIEDLDADEICAKLNRVERGRVPAEVNRLTAFVDCGAMVLWWCVCGWSDGFKGHVIDYGVFPKQNRSYFAAADARPALAEHQPGWSNYKLEALLYAGLKELVPAVVGRAYPRDGGGELKVERCLIDSGWQADTVHQYVRQSQYSALLLASKGYGVSASSSPISSWSRKRGDVVGSEWKVVPVTGGHRQQLCVYDANHWKTHVARALKTPEMGAGCLMLFGDKPAAHQLFADHLTAEYRVQTEGRGRKVEEWKVRPDRIDNHFWDCLVGCAVAASVIGVRWSAAAAVGEAVTESKRVRVSYRELQARAKAAKTTTGGKR